MCYICSIASASDPLAGYDLHNAGETGLLLPALLPRTQTPAPAPAQSPANTNAAYSWDQIASYLTHGYWAYDGGSWRAFELGATRLLTYNISALSAGAQSIAEYALDVWAVATGIRFVAAGSASRSYSEASDAAGSTATSWSITTNSIVRGTVGASFDIDYYRVTLVAGETYLISLSRSGSSQIDPVLELRSASGGLISVSDDPDAASAGEYITFTAPGSGPYYLVARDYAGRTGSYELTIQQAADLTFDDADPTGAYAWSNLTGNRIQASFINIHDRWDVLNLNGYMLQTYIHEIGHALGLGHAGPYNVYARWGTHNIYANDSWSATAMSYFSQSDSTVDSAGYATLATIMPADLIAIQNLYGSGPAGHQPGDTVWGPGGTLGGEFQLLLDMWGGLQTSSAQIYTGEAFAFMVYDTGGNDTLDFSVFSQNQRIDLTPLARSDTGGRPGNVVIARDTIIENAIGGEGHDRITGNQADNLLRGNGGNDTLFGGAGNDTLVGGAGADILDGGTGRDRALYSDAPVGLRVDFLTPAANTGYAAGDRFISIEDLQGSSYNDSLLGDHSPNRILGAGGHDVIYGRGGNDTLFGGAGNDTLVGGAGADILDGGAGRDRALYSDAPVGLRADLLTPATNTGYAAGDSYISIEELQGSSHADTLLGDMLGNRILGAGGHDVIYGRGGNDTIYGGSGDDVIYGGAGNDLLYGGAGADSFVFDTALSPGNVDHIADFTRGEDRIRLDDAVFIALAAGPLAASAFATGAAATTAAHRILYNQASGQIFYDADGNGSSPAVLFATLLPGTALIAADFSVI